MKMEDMDKKVYDVDTLITFGVHKGDTIEDIYDEDCQYLVWMYDNFENVEWTDDALFLINDAIDIIAMDMENDWAWGEDMYDFMDSLE